jgi:pimeloyl-ACP methyl ester carboxylesterase
MQTPWALLVLMIAACSGTQAQTVDGSPATHLALQPVARAGIAGEVELAVVPEAVAPAVGRMTPAPAPRLIVIGFMGGRVSAGNLVHKEALVARALQQRYPATVQAAVFANHDSQNALKLVLKLLDVDGDGKLSAGEKGAARIVIYGHSWGASETVALAKKLNDLSIPVLLTVQVDSVQKMNENDGMIPPNVREAANFYETEGLLHGRTLIAAMDPAKTTILGNYESSYKTAPVSLDGYPWFARTFMKQHIEIENDAAVWDRIEALIGTKVL